MPLQFSSTLIDQIIKGRCADFADLMGCTRVQSGHQRMAVFMPGVTRVTVVSSNGKKELAALQMLHGEGLFCGVLELRKAPSYRLRIECAKGTRLVDDPYRFGRRLDSTELHLFAQGRHESAWRLLGAHVRSFDGVEGVHFVLWAPMARRVSLLLPQHDWDGRVLLMYPHADLGLWELFVPGLQPAVEYKFEVMSQNLDVRVLRCDPFAEEISHEGSLHSRVSNSGLAPWRDHFWQLARSNHPGHAMPLTIHELGLNVLAQQGTVHWGQLATMLLPAVKQLGSTHVLLRDVLAVCSKGKQKQTALVAAASLLGTVNELQRFVEEAHEMELGLLWDLPLGALLESHGIAGSQLSAADWQAQGGALASILIAFVDYWHAHLHVDGFRLRELDTLLLAQTGGARGRNKQPITGECNPFAREWLGFVLQQLRERYPSLLLVVETALPLIELTLSPRKGGMGADHRYEEHKPSQLNSLSLVAGQIAGLARQWQDGNIRQQLVQWHPVEADDAVLQQLQLLALWTLPARKLMQLDFALVEEREWQPEAGHDFRLALSPTLAAGSVELLQFLNQLYPQQLSLHELDASHEGMLVLQATEELCIYERQSRHGLDAMLVILNFSHQPMSAVQLQLGCNRHYRLLRQVNTSQYLHELHTTRTRAVAGCTAVLDLPQHSAALYELVTTA